MKKNRKGLRYKWLGLATLSFLAFGLWFFGREKQGVAEKPRSVKVRIMSMTPTVRATGIVRPQIGAKVKVGARISGRVDRLRANIGDNVRKGQVIALLDRDELKAKVRLAKAKLRSAQAHLSLLRRGARKEELAIAKASLQRGKARLRMATLELVRQRQLVAKRLVPKERLDRAQRDYQVAQANASQANAMLSWKRRRYLPEELRLSSAKVSMARASLRLAQIKESYAIIRAPISGVISSVSTQEGETISAGFRAPTFVTIIDLNRLQVETFVDEVDIGKVKVGQQATFQVDSFPSRDFQGRVSAIYPNAIIQSNVVNYVVIVSLTRQSSSLRPGMTANVTLRFGKDSKVIAVPRQAVRRKGRKHYVLVEGKDGSLAQRSIRIGRRKGRYIEVKSGLKANSRVALKSY